MIGPFRPDTRFDLHVHTSRSDGRFPADDVLLRCARAGLDAVALTDHDLGPALQPGRHVFDEEPVDGRTSDRLGIHLIGAAEISGMHGGREHHLLAYFPAEIPHGFHEFCAGQCRLRAVRYAEAVGRLGLDAAALPSEPALRGEVALTRLHLAQVMVAQARVPTVREAFAQFLSDRHGIVPPIGISYVEAIQMARSFGAVTSWAHPPRKDAERYAGTFAAAGLQALEILRPEVDAGERRALRRIAAREGLVATGGSDWHGWGEEGQIGLFRVLGREIEPFVDALTAAA